MAVYSVNQNRQFYVVNEASDFVGNKTTDEGEIFLTFKGVDGNMRTDLIDPKTITMTKHTTAADMARKLKVATVTVDGNLVKGQTYVLRIDTTNYLAPGDANVLVKAVAVKAESTTADATFYKKFEELLKKSFKNDNLFTFTSSASGLVITEVEQSWRLGVLSSDPVNFTVHTNAVLEDGEEVKWGKVVKSEGVKIGNGKQVADLEYFCLAERGDMFRNMGWPNNIDVKYLVDPKAEYDLIDIHYSYAGNGVDNQKSEKDITIACKGGVKASDIMAIFNPTEAAEAAEE